MVDGDKVAPPVPGISWHAISSDEAALSLDSNLTRGLTSAEAQQRRAQYGLNELTAKAGTPRWKKFLEQFTDFIVLILLAAAAISGLLGEWLDAIAISVIVLLNAVIGFIQEYQAEQAIEALKQMTAPHARVLREGNIVDIEARHVVPGDVLLLEQGDIVPADARLISAQNLQIEEAALTGESVPIKKQASAVMPSQASLGDQKNMLFASTRVTYGRGRALVTGTGMTTQLGKIAGLVEGVVEEKTPLQKRLDDVGRYLVYGALAIVTVVFLLGLLRGEALVEMFLVSVSLAVAAVPEGLAAVVTIALALGVRRLAARHALIRRLPSVETLGSTTVIASDKTGTLTQNQMTIRRIVVDGRTIEVGGEGYEPAGRFYYNGETIDPKSDSGLMAVLRTGAIANAAQLQEGEGRWSIMGDPTEGAILTAAAKADYWRDSLMEQYSALAELPFDSDRKRMSVIARAPGGEIGLFVKGAPDIILELSSQVVRGEEIVSLDDATREAIAAANDALAQDALRVLAVAQRILPALPDDPTPALESDLIFIGLVGMIDPPRPEAVASVRIAHEAGIRTIMITGDHRETAVAIASELGMFQPGDQALTGAELEQISDQALIEQVERIKVYARVSPEHKLRIVRAWKARGEIVAMTGDGVNDAPALKEANIGIAMGITGTDVSKEAADMILADDNFATIVAAVEEGRSIFDNIRRFIQFLLSCNIGEVLAMFFAVLLGMPIPLLPIQILWINLATDSLPALALGIEPATPGLMQRPPRPAGEALITRSLATLIGFQGLVIGAVTLGAFTLEYFWRDPGNLERARVMAFSTSIFAQNIHAFNLRSTQHSIFKLGFFTNPYLIGATVIVLLSELAIIYIPFLQPIFKTVPLSWSDWGWVLSLGIVPLIVMEIAKAMGLRR
ncbi:MAG: calcium-translocating P-type ATPase, SERCA-type [Ardenticatenales bacterium]|nr:calcium-translocating P-type ATPase, SERCA-type [Ardenticatenales bacterium]